MVCIATTRLIPLHIGKNRSVSTAINDIIGYSANPQKTDNGKLISSYACDSRVADKEFTLSKMQYEYITGRNQGDKNVIAYHTRQSFPPGEISAEDANKLGYELAMRFTKGNHAFVVCTHIDKSHYHNHIIFNSTTLDCRKKFVDFWRSGKAVRRISDQICLENGLSIIENPKPSVKENNYGTWLGKNKKPSFQTIIKQAIDNSLEQNPKDFKSFLNFMKAQNIQVIPRGKQITFRAPGQERVTRCNTLKGNYTERAIRERIAGTRAVSSSGSAVQQNEKVNLLIDIQERLQAGKGAGYERWAKMFNLKEMAKTLVFLQENEITDYAELEKKASSATKEFNTISAKIKTAESRLKKIKELQNHISNYSKTREVYRQYRAAGYSKVFRSEHESEIILHQSAKSYFDKLGLEKLPTMKTLRQEYAERTTEKKKLYGEYREAKESMRQLVTARANADRILNNIPPVKDKDIQRNAK